VLAGIGVMSRGQFSRWIGVIGAAIGGLSAVAWLPYYPIWSLIYIFLAVMVMYALLAYGGRETRAS
jgi:membrane protein implicated in regulation of membrane protease activity